MKFGKSALLATALIGLGACGRSDDELAKNAAIRTSANDVSMEDSMMADPSNPFATAEMKMNRAMMGAVGTSISDSWVRLMIAHHQGAVEMARVALQQDVPADVKKMAQETIDKQSKEIADLQKLIQQGNQDPNSLGVYRPAMMQMHQAMMTAKGTNVSETFLQKMLEHHRGGVTLSDVALVNHVSGALRTQVQKTRAGQKKDAEMVEAMLRGASSKDSESQTSENSKVSENESSTSKAMPAPGTRTPEHEVHDMNNMNHDMNNM